MRTGLNIFYSKVIVVLSRAQIHKKLHLYCISEGSTSGTLSVYKGQAGAQGVKAHT